jgi:RNA polymerase sigma-70 factor, ECF subfamily
MADTGEPEAVPDADVELYKLLREAGRTDRAWWRAEAELFHYGWSVLLAWLRSGLIAQKYTEKGLPADWSMADQDDVASVAVGDGLAVFGRAVEADRWHPSFGASLKTYFLGGCVLAIPNALRLWRHCRDRYHGSVAELAKLAGSEREAVSPVDVLASVEAVEDLVRDENERNQAIRKLNALDYDPAEIAEILRMTHLPLAADLDLPDALLEASSLGAPGARALRARARREDEDRRRGRLAGLERRRLHQSAAVRRASEAVLTDWARREDAATSDADLLVAHTNGDPHAFAALIKRHRARLWAVALRTLRDPEEAADALQEAFISAHRRADSFRAESQISTWLYRIVVNACLDRVRRRQARPVVPLPEADVDMSVAARDPIAERETMLVVRAALAKLPEDQRVPIVLVDVEGYSVAEAAGILGVAEGTVKSRAARGRARLAKILGHLRSPDS